MDTLFNELIKLARDNPDRVVDILQKALDLLKLNPKVLSALLNRYVKD